MATRSYFCTADAGAANLFEERLANFQFFTGFAVSQKQLSIDSMHRAIIEDFPNARVLEVSTKSRQELGVRLSAFNLKLRYLEALTSVECAFQSGKVFKNGGPYRELIHGTSLEAKRDSRIRNSGLVLRYELEPGVTLPLESGSDFYDSLYLQALVFNPDLLDALIEFDTFTDIEFTKTKLGIQKGRPYNTQARSCAIATTLHSRGGVDAIRQHIEHLKVTNQNYPLDTLF